jgi:recombination protein RecT
MAEQQQEAPQLTPAQIKEQERQKALQVQNQKFASVKLMMDKYKDSIAKALPKHLTVERMTRVMLTTITKTPALLDCTQHTLMSAILTVSQLGLSVDPLLGEAYLIPFKNKKKGITECTVIIGYKGLLGLARRSGMIDSISCSAVFASQKVIKYPDEIDSVEAITELFIEAGMNSEKAAVKAAKLWPLGDYFAYEKGLNEKLEHRPGQVTDTSKITHFYAVVRFKDGGHLFNVMNRAQVEAVRNESQGWKAFIQYGNITPWNTNFEEMGNKTVLRRLMKFLPLSPDIQRTVGMDEQHEAGVVTLNPILMDDEEVTSAAMSENTVDGEAEVIQTENPPADEKAKAATEALKNSLNITK